MKSAYRLLVGLVLLGACASQKPVPAKPAPAPQTPPPRETARPAPPTEEKTASVVIHGSNSGSGSSSGSASTAPVGSRSPETEARDRRVAELVRAAKESESPDYGHPGSSSTPGSAAEKRHTLAGQLKGELAALDRETKSYQDDLDFLGPDPGFATGTDDTGREVTWDLDPTGREKRTSDARELSDLAQQRARVATWLQRVEEKIAASEK
jgi:hypothetical protein